ncbi:MAG: DUF1829 domain-containing protein [Gammaproteobacteria bacterium]|nr:DUF1829 domain-containing protein [Gammaproteobacteria bacterium]
MNRVIHELLEDYSNWLRDKTNFRNLDNCIEITTPYLDRHNDYLQIYVKRINDELILSDDGYVLEDLELSGCKIESKKHKTMFYSILNGFGVSLNGQALEVKITPDKFPLNKHNLLQAMLAVNDLFFLTSPGSTEFFKDDVTAWLDHTEIRYTPSIIIIGKSKFNHRFDFAIPKSKIHPERLIRVINRPERNTAQSLAFSWIDTKEARPSGSRAYAILNDLEGSISESIIEAMLSYEVHTVPWSQRDKAVNELAM